MASFYVQCNKCLQKLAKKAKKEKRDITAEEFDELVLFETEYSVKATDVEIAEAMICPRCKSSECEKTYLGYNNICYIRGNGYLDKAGCKRDMNLFHLTQDDPYGNMRQPGEVEHLKDKLKRGGQHDPKPKHFTTSTDMQRAVKKSVSKKSKDV